jgi:hypothetical protein
MIKYEEQWEMVARESENEVSIYLDEYKLVRVAIEYE